MQLVTTEALLQEGFKAIRGALNDYAAACQAGDPNRLRDDVIQVVLYLTRTHTLFTSAPEVQQDAWRAVQAAHQQVATSAALFPVAHGMMTLADSAMVLSDGAKDSPSLVGAVDIGAGMAADAQCAAGLVDVIMDIGPPATASADTLRTIMHSQGRGRGDGLQRLRPREVAQLLVRVANASVSPTGGADGMGDMGAIVAAALAKADGASPSPRAGGPGWNLDVLHSVLSEECRRMSWDLVVRCLDLPHDALSSPAAHPQNIISGGPAFEQLVRSVQQVSASPFPVKSLLEDWTHSRAQMALLEQAVQQQPPTLSFAGCEPMLEPVAGSPKGYGSRNQAWGCVPLYRCLLRLALAGGLEAPAVRILEGGQNQCPELVLLALSVVKVQAGVHCAMDDGHPLRTRAFDTILTAAYSKLFHASARGAPPSGLQSALLKRMWQVSPVLVVNSLLRLAAAVARNFVQPREATSPHVTKARVFKQIFDCVSRVVHLVKDLPGGIHALTHSVTQPDAVAHAGLAVSLVTSGDRSVFDLQAWLQKGLRRGNIVFARSLIQFLRSALRSADLLAMAEHSAAVEAAKSSGVQAPSVRPVFVVPPETLVLCLINFAQHAKLGAHNAGLVSAARNMLSMGCRQFAPLSGALRQYIQHNAAAFVASLLSEKMSVGDGLEQLQTMAKSQDEQQGMVFSATVRALMDCISQRLPSVTLAASRAIGQLLGRLINNEVLPESPQGIGLRHVLEALSKDPSESKNKTTFTFAEAALGEFVAKLPSWSQVARHVLAVPHLTSGAPELAKRVRKTLGMPESAPAPVASKQSRAAAAPASAPTPAPAPAAAPSGSAAPAKGHVDTTTLPSSMDAPSIAAAATAAAPSSASAPAQESARDKARRELRAMVLRGGARLETALAEAVIGIPGRGDGSVSAARVEVLDLGRIMGSAGKPSAVHAPPASIRDRVQKIVNSLTKTNVSGHASDCRSFIKPEHLKWLAQYLVSRVSAQPNYHEVYAQWLQGMGIKDLTPLVLDATFVAVRKTLGSDKIRKNPSERSVLKNLGAWLGQMLLRKNKPLLQRMLDMKELLLQAYETAHLVAAMGFVAKVLESAKSSRVFKPPNPWTMAMLGVMKEITEVPEIKMNLKFELQVLCNTLSIEVKDIPPSRLLQQRIRPALGEGNADFTGKAAQMQEKNAVSIPGITPQEAAANRMASLSRLLPDLNSTLRAVAAKTSASPQLQDALRLAMPLALDAGVREVLPKTVERSVRIACDSTQHLVVKDFACDGNPARFEGAAQLVVGRLAGSIALATCTDNAQAALYRALCVHLPRFLSVTDPRKLQEIAGAVALELLDLAQLLVEKAAMDAAVRVIDKRLSMDVRRRKELAANMRGGAFADPAVMQDSARWMPSLPVSLRPTAGGLSAGQIKVYEAFGTSSPWSAAAAAVEAPGQQAAPAAPAAPAAAAPADTGAGAAAAAIKQVPVAVPETSTPPTTQAPSMAPPPISAAHAKQPVAEMVAPSPIVAAAEHISAAAASQQYQTLMGKLTAAVHKVLQADSGAQLSKLPPTHEVCQLLETIGAVAGKVHAAQRDAAGVSFVRSLWVQLLEVRESSLALSALLHMLGSATAAVPVVRKELTSWLTAMEPERIPHRVVLLGMLSASPSLIAIAEMDAYVERSLGSERTPPVAVAQLVWLIFTLVATEKARSATDFRSTIDAIAALSKQQRSSAACPFLAPVSSCLTACLAGQTASPERTADANRLLQAALSPKSSGNVIVSVVTGIADPDTVRHQSLVLLETWVRICAEANVGATTPAAYTQFLDVLRTQGVLASDSSAERFLRIIMELCVQSCKATAQAYPAAADSEVSGFPPRTKLQYTGVDAMCKLVILLIKSADTVVAQVMTLSKVLSVVARTLMLDAELNSAVSGTGAFDPRPYFRLLCDLLTDLHFADGIAAADSSALAFELQSLSAVAHVLHALRPEVVPAFAFSWSGIVSNSTFLPRLMALPGRAGWPLLHRLLVDMLRFQWPFMEKRATSPATSLLYKATLRTMLVLLHDFPEFLCDYHVSLCNEMHSSCVQLRNLALSAYPAGMRLPDPFAPNLNLAQLVSGVSVPAVPASVAELLQSAGVLQEVDAYLAGDTRGISAALPSKLAATIQAGSTQWKAETIPALVVHTVQSGVSSGNITAEAGPHMQLVQGIVAALRPDKRYLLLNHLVNQLRYPNAHTCFAAHCVWRLFLGGTVEHKEQLTRVMLERLVVHRPHPWGLLVTFNELLRNPVYAFWSHSFTKGDGDMEKLFANVSRSFNLQGQSKA